MNRLVNANISKRLGAFLLDAFMVIILGTLLYSGFAQIFIRTPAFSEATKIMNEILVETHLYEYDEEDRSCRSGHDHDICARRLQRQGIRTCRRGEEGL